jgi:hypothetical protein
MAGGEMKGIVFTEFLEMVEDRFPEQIVEQLIESVDLPSGGIYTSVGTYSFQEMITLVSRLSELVGIPGPDLLRAFGQYLLKRFVEKFPHFFEGITSTLDFLPTVESLVHLEVKKLYPDAELPTFSCEFSNSGQLVMIYRSARNLPDLAEGLILGCGEHFRESLGIEKKNISENPPAVQFTITVKK